jgi:hypothetical protein
MGAVEERAGFDQCLTRSRDLSSDQTWKREDVCAICPGMMVNRLV